MRSYILSLILLLGAVWFAGLAAQASDLAAGQDAEGSLTAKAKRARTLFKNRSFSEAAVLARQVLLQKPDGRGSDELRVLLCKAKTVGADVGDPATTYSASADLSNPDSKPLSVQPPEKIFGAKPQFGSRAREAGDQGLVIVTAVIDEDGCVKDPKVTRGLNAHVDQDILRVFRYWVFRPALVQGKPIKLPHTLTVGVRFDRR